MIGALICLLSNLVFTAESVAMETATPRRMVILGDSLTAGYGIAKADAYPALLEAKLKETKASWQVANGGRSGDTTKNGLARLRWLLKKPADVLVIALGGNDGLRGLSSEEMRKNLKAMVDLARKDSPNVKIVLAGMQMPDNMGVEYVKAFQEVFPSLAHEEKLTLIPFLLEGIAGDDAFNQEDRIHPNEDGHKKIAETVWKALQPLVTESP